LKKNLVSVVINCFNGEKYLNQCINSVINQTWTNWEIIFWDNQSTDNSKNIVLNYKDERIKYFYAPTHELLYSARNYAIKKSSGDYIAFLDTDDIWEPQKLELQIHLLQKSEIGIVCSNYLVINERLNTKKKQYKDFKNHYLKTDDLLKKYKVGLLTIIIRKSELEKIEFPYFNPSFNIIGDFDLICKLSLITKIYYMNNILASYRLHEKNVSFTQRNKIFDEFNLWHQNNLENNSFINFQNYKYFYSQFKFYTILQKLLQGNKKGIINFENLTLKYSFLLLLLLIIPKNILNYYYKNFKKIDG
jgi:glycosyltransferase involved in cell wall biosynthesis